MIKQYTVSRDDSIYEAFPDIAEAPNGDLLCVFLECEHHIKRQNCRIMITRSANGGKTWSKKEPFSEMTCGDGMTYNCPRINLLPDGCLAVCCDLIFFGKGEHGAMQHL